MKTAPVSDPDDMPVPSPMLVLLRVFTVAYLSTAHERPRRRAKAFLAEAARVLESEHTLGQILPIRPTSQAADVAKARRQAIALYRQLLPVFIASLPGDEA